MHGVTPVRLLNEFEWKKIWRRFLAAVFLVTNYIHSNLITYYKLAVVVLAFKGIQLILQLLLSLYTSNMIILMWFLILYCLIVGDMEGKGCTVNYIFDLLIFLVECNLRMIKQNKISVGFISPRSLGIPHEKIMVAVGYLGCNNT